MKQEVMDWLEHWLLDHLTCDTVTPSSLVTGTSLKESEVPQLAIDFIYAGLASKMLDLLPQGVLFGGGELGFHGPLDYANELMRFNPFDFDDLLAGRAAWGGPRIALSKDGIDLLSSFGLKFSETYGEDKEDRRQRFLAEMIRRFEDVGVQLGDIAYIRAPQFG